MKHVKIRSKFGITSKLFTWFLSIVLIFYGTILLLYVNAQQIVGLSEQIVNTNYPITAYSKKMTENLLSLEENDTKYHLLYKKEYFDFFISAQKKFEKNLAGILDLKSKGMPVSKQWQNIYIDYKSVTGTLEISRDKTPSDALWIPESVINGWMRKISLARNQNEQAVQDATLELNRRGLMTARNGLVGLGIASAAGLIGIFFLAYSMIRPLRELRKGIRAVSKEGPNLPIRIRSKDEFGELADTFNEMTALLKEEEEMRSDFIAMLSHEIRTPLTSIRESVNMLTEEVLGPVNQQQKKFLAIAGTEIVRMSDLLNRLMFVSRLESGGLALEPRRIEVPDFISECILHVSLPARSKNIAIETDAPPNLPNVMADPDQLQRVLSNLLRNAVKFSDSGGKIKVTAALDKNDRNVIFSISDNGPGIPETEQSLIFNKYYQARGMRKQADGVGLGLSISRQIVKAHKGDIMVSSLVGKGSTFYFTIPVARTETAK